MGINKQTGYLGGDDSVVGVPLWDVGLSTRRGFPVSHVDGPAVHPVLLSGTLRPTGCGQWRQHRPGLKALPAVLAVKLLQIDWPCPAKGTPSWAESSQLPPVPKEMVRAAVCSPARAASVAGTGDSTGTAEGSHTNSSQSSGCPREWATMGRRVGNGPQ